MNFKMKAERLAKAKALKLFVLQVANLACFKFIKGGSYGAFYNGFAIRYKQVTPTELMPVLKKHKWIMDPIMGSIGVTCL